jgi:hypothetical protein
MKPTEGRRHCGRCQQEFDADPTLWLQTEWSLCPACREILLPRRSTDDVPAASKATGA